MSDVRLIDANALKYNLNVENAVKYGNESPEQLHNSYTTMMRYEIADYIDDAPTIDAVEVVHGRLEGDHLDYKCSACGTAFHDDIFWIQGDHIAPKHCPECGARWTEVVNE